MLSRPGPPATHTRFPRTRLRNEPNGRTVGKAGCRQSPHALSVQRHRWPILCRRRWAFRPLRFGKAGYKLRNEPNPASAPGRRRLARTLFTCCLGARLTGHRRRNRPIRVALASGTMTYSRSRRVMFPSAQSTTFRSHPRRSTEGNVRGVVPVLSWRSL